MAVKQSLEDNKDFILGTLPTQELKDAFLADLDKVEEPAAPSVEEQVAEAQAPDHVSEDMYDGIKAEIEAAPPVVKMTEEEEKAAIAEGLKNPPTPSEEPAEEEG